MLKPTDRLYYRWYNKTHEQVIALLPEPTEGRFHTGAIARVLFMEFWTSGQARTFRELAAAWDAALREPRSLGKAVDEQSRVPVSKLGRP